MDWGDLKYLLELARSGSLSATARRLRVDHSTVSRRVSALEASLSAKLFNRLPRGYELTAEGERIVALASTLEGQILAIERAAQGQAGGIAGTVRISAPPVFASHFIAPRLAPLRTAHPDLVIELVGEMASANLVRREADLAVRLSRPENASLVARRIGTMTFGLYGARAYVDTHAGCPDYLGYDESLEDVAQQRWVNRLSEGRPLVFRSNDLASLYQAVRAGLGVAALPTFLAAGDADLVRLPTNEDAPDREIWLVVHPDLRRSKRIRVVMDHLVETMADVD